MTRAAALRGSAETVPIQYDTSERVVGRSCSPCPRRLGVAGWRAWAGSCIGRSCRVGDPT